MILLRRTKRMIGKQLSSIIRLARRETGSASIGRKLFDLGISGKIQVAFGVVVSLTMIAATTAMLSFSAIEDVLQDFVGKRVPVMTDSMRLSVISGDISAAAARFISAKTSDEQEATLALIARKRGDLKLVINRLNKADEKNPEFEKYLALSGRIEANIAELEEAISDGTNLRAQMTTLLDALRNIHSQIIESLSQLGQQREVLEVSDKTNLIVGLMGDAAVAKEAGALKPIQNQFNSAILALEKSTAALGRNDIQKLADQLKYFGDGATSVFARRTRELAVAAQVDCVVDANVAIQRELDGVVAALVKGAERGMLRGLNSLFENIYNNRMLLLVVVIASLMAAGLAVNYVQRKLVQRLLKTEDAMRLLSSGETNFPVPNVTEQDEIGQMARALEVFRAGEIERRTLSQRERAEQIQQRERAALIDKIISEFRATVTSAIRTVT